MLTRSSSSVLFRAPPSLAHMPRGIWQPKCLHAVHQLNAALHRAQSPELRPLSLRSREARPVKVELPPGRSASSLGAPSLKSSVPMLLSSSSGVVIDLERLLDQRDDRLRVVLFEKRPPEHRGPFSAFDAPVETNMEQKTACKSISTRTNFSFFLFCLETKNLSTGDRPGASHAGNRGSKPLRGAN